MRAPNTCDTQDDVHRTSVFRIKSILWRAGWSTQVRPVVTMDRNWQPAQCEQEKDRDAGPYRAQHEPTRVHPRSPGTYPLARGYDSLRTEMHSAMFALFASTGCQSWTSGLKPSRSNSRPRLISRLSCHSYQISGHNLILRHCHVLQNPLYSGVC